jgi:hypothetical protein
MTNDGKIVGYGSHLSNTTLAKGNAETARGALQKQA